MTRNNAAPVSLETRRNIVSRPIDNDTMLTLVGAGDLGRGPWPFVTGIPGLHSNLAGPPAQYLSVAGWAA